SITMPTRNPAGAPIPLPMPTAIGTLPSCPVSGDIAANEMKSTPPRPTAFPRSLWISCLSEISTADAVAVCVSPEPKVSIYPPDTAHRRYGVASRQDCGQPLRCDRLGPDPQARVSRPLLLWSTQRTIRPLQTGCQRVDKRHITTVTRLFSGSARLVTSVRRELSRRSQRRHAQCISWPPDTLIACPVIAAAASPAR